MAQPSGNAFALDGYADIRQVGAGGMAIVYSATQTAFKRPVAIKVLMPAFTTDKEFAERFMREAQIVASLSHPHIIPVYDFGQRNQSFYMVMEFLKGGDLSKRIQGGLTEDQILQITSDIADALHFAHQKGFIHRDVKPDNVMFREDNSAVLTDFGIARKQDANTQMTKAGQTVGTPRYMSPEQLQGRKVDGRTDIYALGIMFYEMLTKKTPYEDEDFMALAMKHMQAPIPKLPEKHARFQKLFERMVAKDPQKRFQNGKEIVDIIQQIRAGKLDVAKIDSGAAAELKKAALDAAAKKVSGGSADPAASRRVHIPREQMIALQDVEPLLDVDWAKTVSGIFSKLGQAERKHVYEEFLQPKGIFIDPQKKQFAFKGKLTVQEVATEIIEHPELKGIAEKLIKTEQMIRTTRDANAFSDIIEGSLSIIDRFDSQENLGVQKQKIILREAFLNDLVKITRDITFDLPASRRFMSLDMIKIFIIQIYLRHELMGYRFRTMPVNVLEQHNDPFVKGVVAPEASTRQCEIVNTDGYLFLIGPVKSADQNPYSIRRFMKEDEAMGGQVVYFNVVAFPVANLVDEKFQEGVRWMISRIVTLERQLSPVVVDMVRMMDKSHQTQLIPALLKPITADGTEIEKAIEKRMADYEKQVSMMILGKLPKALSEMVKTNDDLEFLFFHARRLLIEMACDVRDFAAQSAAVWSRKAEEMDLRMMAYLKLLDKRRPSLFVLDRSKQLEVTLDPAFPLAEFKKAMDDHEAEIEALNNKLRKLLIEAEQPPKTGFKLLLEKIFGGGNKNKETVEDVQTQITLAKSRCLVALVRARKRYPVITVYLEFEDLMPVDERCRHYALPAGTDGLSRLPVLVELPEKAENFDPAAVKKTLESGAFGAS